MTGSFAPSTFIPFTMNAKVREGRRHVFSQDLERLVHHGIEGASFTVLESSNGTAKLRGVIPAGVHTANGPGLARFLEDRLASEKCVDLDLDVQLVC